MALNKQPKGDYSYQAIRNDEGDINGVVPPIDSSDFKIGVTVEQSSPEIRALFVRRHFNHCGMWFVFVPLVGSFVSIGLVYWKRESHPANFLMLALFTLFEALLLGILVATLDKGVVLRALALTAFVFIGLTLFTLQSKYDMSSLQQWLYWGLMILVGGCFVQLLFPFAYGLQLATAVGGCVVFSGYIMYDTWMLQRRLNCDEWILANVSLYLDMVNLFISILRLMNSTDDS
ncbi:hypothetical protein MVES1_003291 [Malassezia vespertilionis]|uniref:Uncharacterized protein n=1 Tax=Malassezia vespertilionis TaxID=2020962 RepID=A0A2N1J6V4_9BASI|nr:uncharacterized protein MVES1_003291 [Malassezia vespertilionis]PKI82295.1 hypothetical protein MVES_003801 [Malassezia vespertilionis]WFD07922.1 hypothetical protein MVES1_003291 [Malassezia vespertilionis]